MKLTGDVELDESYFWAKRVRGFRWKLKRWRWTRKQPVFWILKRKWEIYTEIIPNCTGKVLKDIIIKIIDCNAVVHTDWRKWYDGLVDVWFDKHYRVNHGQNEFSKWDWQHINWIEKFWSFTKRRFNKFNGVRINFNLHLKECEFRYGKSAIEIEEKLIKLLKVKFKNKK
jgi:transposase-like protein